LFAGTLASVDVAELRSRFPVFERVAYLNAGTCGPVAAEAVAAGAQVARLAQDEGRDAEYFAGLVADRERVRSAYAALLGAETADVSITTSTSEGVVRVLAGLGLGGGDEVLTTADEHPAVLGPLAALARRHGITVRAVPVAELGGAAGPRTRLIACSHVSWVNGACVADDVRDVAGVPVLLDGAQGIGAVPVDVAALRCAFYVGSGQKWLCGPVGTGMLWIAPEWRERVAPLGPTYVNLSDPDAGLSAEPFPDGRAHDAFAVSAEVLRAAVVAHGVLADAGWPAVHARARELAGTLAAALADRGRVVAQRGDATLVSWEEDDPPAVVAALARARVVVRSVPGTRYVRASVGAWNDEGDLERLLATL
jgi:L-cysteine/cystine lyase